MAKKEARGENIGRDEINFPGEDTRNCIAAGGNSDSYAKGKNVGLCGVRERSEGVGQEEARQELAEETGVWDLQWERSYLGGQGKGKTHRELGTEVFKNLRIYFFFF